MGLNIMKIELGALAAALALGLAGPSSAAIITATTFGETLTNGAETDLRGGIYTGPYSSPGTALLKIGGGQALIPNDYYSTDILDEGLSTQQSVDISPGVYMGQYLNSYATQSATGVDTPNDLTSPTDNLCAADVCTSSFKIYERNIISETVNEDAAGVLSPINYTITVSPSVPEPATWAMMLMGFGGLGAAMRRSRRARAGEPAAVADIA